MTATLPAEKDRTNLKPDKIFGIRHLEALLLFTGLTIAYAMRVTMSVAIVAMTDPTASEANVPTFPEWTQQATILSSFFWGYVVTQIPSGMIAERFGGTILLAVAMAVNALVSMLTPLAATSVGWQGVCACRVAQGLAQGAFFPAMHGLQAKWVPFSERGRLTTFIYTGAQMGTIMELIVAGFLAGSRLGWPAIFYSVGIAGVLWTVAWLFLAADSPRQHKWISEEELKYIESSYTEIAEATREISGIVANGISIIYLISGRIRTFGLGRVRISEKKTTAPWKAILTSVPLWALMIAHCGQNWGFWTLLTEMPSYMKSILGVDIKSNGLLSALPYVAMFIFSQLFGYVSDYSINSEKLSRTTARKLGNTVAFWGPAIFLLGLSYSPSGNLAAAVALLTFTVGLNGSHYTGFLVNHIDLSPNFAPTLMGITNMVSNILSILAPLSVGLIVKDESNAFEWRIVFFISAAVYFVTNLCFIVFGTAELQKWNEISMTDDSNEIEKNPAKKEHFDPRY